MTHIISLIWSYLLLAVPVAAQRVPDQSIEAVAVAAVEASIQAAPLPKKNVPQIVRLAFHDCVGGCDGCLTWPTRTTPGLRISSPSWRASTPGVGRRAPLWPPTCLALTSGP